MNTLYAIMKIMEGLIMKDILIDALVDSIKLLPFLFIAFLLIELFEHKLGKKTKKAITKTKKLGPVIGSVLGAIPQCGFSVVATNLYVTRIISLGTLVSIYLSTSDEMLPILLSHNAPLKDILTILGFKIIIGMIVGFVIDLLIRKKDNTQFLICEKEHCECEESILKSSLIHTLKTIIFIFIVTLGLNMLITYISEEVLAKVFIKNSHFAPFLASLVGLIPNCASSIIITEFYLNNVITMGTCIAGLLTNSGIAILVLFKTNKNLKENIAILTLIYLIGAIFGVFINFL